MCGYNMCSYECRGYQFRLWKAPKICVTCALQIRLEYSFVYNPFIRGTYFRIHLSQKERKLRVIQIL